MKIQQINKNTPEHVDIVVTNAAGATITLGYAVALTTTAASVDGNKAVLPAASQIQTFVGIALDDIPDNEVGLVRAYGYAASTFIFAAGTSVTNAVGIALGPGVAGSNGVNSTGLKDLFAPVIALEAIGAAINSPGGYAKTFVRAL
jgi:hypothetical protein